MKKRILQERENHPVFLILRTETIYQLANMIGKSNFRKIVFNWGKIFKRLCLSQNRQSINIAFVKGKNCVIEKLNMPGPTAHNSSYPYRLYGNLPVIFSKYRKKPVCLTNISPFDDDTFCFKTPHNIFFKF